MSRRAWLDETSRYTSAFRGADLSIPDNAANLAVEHRSGTGGPFWCIKTALAAAGFQPPSWQPSVHGLFSRDFIAALDPARNPNSNNIDRYREAHAILSNRSGCDIVGGARDSV